MSDTGFLACSTCGEVIMLGKPVRREDGSVKYFHLGSRRSPRNSMNVLLDESVWKFFADHAGHDLGIRFDYEEEFGDVEDYVEVGGDAADGGIPFESYLSDWEGITELGAHGDLLRDPGVRIDDFSSSTGSDSVAIHVDLPHSYREQWAQRLARDGGLIEVSVRDVNRSVDVARELGVSTVSQIKDVSARGLLFVHFEQIWTKNRPVAIELLHVLPRALAAVRADGRSLHVGLVDLSSSTADSILAEFRNVSAEGIGEPITVFNYPPMP